MTALMLCCSMEVLAGSSYSCADAADLLYPWAGGRVGDGHPDLRADLRQATLRGVSNAGLSAVQSLSAAA